MEPMTDLPSPAMILQRLGFRPDGSVDLALLGLTQAAIEARRHFVGGSDATIIGKADPAAINKLWAFKRGAPPEDLSEELAVQLGIFTEPFNIAWTEKKLGRRITRRGEVVRHPDIPWMAATLDGWDDGRVVQAKHVNGFWKPAELLAHYSFQLHHEMIVTGAREALLVVIFGNQKHEIFTVPYDAYFAGELLEAEEAFWAAVQDGREPHPAPVAPLPLPAEALVPVDMTGSNEFADAAARWLQHRPSAEAFAKAEADLKGLIPDTAAKAYGYGVEVVRNARGAKSVRALKSETV